MIKLNNKIIGLAAPKVVQEIVSSNKQISGVILSKYTPPPLLQDRIILNEVEKKFISDSMIIRNRYNLPFWNSIMLNSFGNNESIEKILQEALFHKTNHGGDIIISREEIGIGKLYTISESTDDKFWLSLTSEMKVLSKSMHLPLLDFHCPINNSNERIVIEVSKLLFPDGFIVLCSEKSYHCYGLLLVSEQKLLEILAKSLLFSPIIDGAYIAHQLLERRCCLRISKGGDQKKQPIAIYCQQRS